MVSVPKSFEGACCALLHAVSFACAALSVYLFLGTSFENVLVAFELLGVFLALEAVAAVINRKRKQAQ
jgi:hypothetical protein